MYQGRFKRVDNWKQNLLLTAKAEGKLWSSFEFSCVENETLKLKFPLRSQFFDSFSIKTQILYDLLETCCKAHKILSCTIDHLNQWYPSLFKGANFDWLNDSVTRWFGPKWARFLQKKLTWIFLYCFQKLRKHFASDKMLLFKLYLDK